MRMCLRNRLGLSQNYLNCNMSRSHANKGARDFKYTKETINKKENIIAFRSRSMIR